MKSYADFRKNVKMKGPEIENLTGYTRQGLYFAFNMIDEGSQPAKKFLVCINSVIDKVIQKETEQYQERMKKLGELRERLRCES